MKFLNIIQCSNLAGMERASLRLMQSMQDRGHEFELVSLHPLGGLAGELTKSGVPSKGLRYFGPLGISVILQLLKILRTSDYEQIIMTGPHLCAMIAMKLAGRRGAFLAVHFHHAGVKSNRSWRVIYRMALDRFDWITFPSDFVRNEACTILPALRDRSVTIRYPHEPPPEIDQNERLLARQRLGLGMDDFIVGNAGWLITRKRFDVFIKVAAKVLSTRPNAGFVIAGGGEEEESLKALAKEFGINDQIHWLGWLTDLSDFYASLDAMLFNADWDTLPVTPQEAVAHGIPLVASLVNGGLREVFDDRLSEKILHEHNIELLANQLLEIADNPEAAATEAAKSQQAFLAISNPTEIAIQHEKLLSVR